MSLVIPTTDVDPREYVKGAGKLFIGTYVANGGDANDLAFLGATDGGDEYNENVANAEVMCDQYLNPVDAFPTKEEHTWKATFWQLNLANYYRLIGGQNDLVLAGGGPTDATSSLTIGEQKSRRVYQLVWTGMAPAGATNSLRIGQFWKAFIKAKSAIKYTKTKEAFIEITWGLLTDVTAIANGKGAVGQWLDS